MDAENGGPVPITGSWARFAWTQAFLRNRAGPRCAVNTTLLSRIRQPGLWRQGCARSRCLVRLSPIGPRRRVQLLCARLRCVRSAGWRLSGLSPRVVQLIVQVLARFPELIHALS